MRKVRNKTKNAVLVNLDTKNAQGTREEIVFGPRGSEDDTQDLTPEQYASKEIQRLLGSTMRVLENRR